MNESSPTLTAPDAERPRMVEAYQYVHPEIMAVPEDKILSINLDVPTAVTTILGAMGPIRSLRPRIVEELPKFDLVRFDKLEIYTLALNHAHALHLAYEAPAATVTALAEQASTTRDLFLADALALSKRKMIDGSRIIEIKPTTSYRQFAVDLLVLAQIFRANLKAIEGKSAINASELDNAVSLADRLMVAMGERDQLGSAPSSAMITRQKAFTLFFETYRDARRAALYLELDDADDFVPTLYAGRTPSRKRGEEAKPEKPGSDQPAQVSTIMASESTPRVPVN